MLLLSRGRGARHTITKNVVWLTVSQIGSRLIRAVIIIYAARALGAAEYGVFSYAIGLAAFFTVFSDMGINAILTREIAKMPEKKSMYFSTAFIIKIILFIGTGLLIIGIAPHISNIERANALLIFIAGMVALDGVRDFSSAIFRAGDRMELEALVGLLTNIFIVVAGFITLHFISTAKAFTISYVLATGLGSLIALALLRKEILGLWRAFEKRLILPLFNAAWPVTLSGILGAFMLNTDMVMLGWWQGPEQIGVYAASQRIIQVFYAIPAIFASASFPTLARFIGKQDQERARLLTEKGITAALFMAIPMAAGGMILSASLIRLIYGDAYLGGTSTFTALMLTIPLAFVGTMINNVALAYNKQRLASTYLFIAALGNAFLDAMLIPRFGIIGSAIATVIAMAINTGLIWHLVKQMNDFFVLRHLKKITAATLVMAVLSAFLDRLGVPVLITIGVALIAYLATLYALKEKLLREARILLRASTQSPT